MKHLGLYLLLVALAAGVAGSGVTLWWLNRQAPEAMPAVENFALVDQNGDLTELYRQSLAKAVVLFSYAAGCPIVRKDLPAIENLRAKYAAQGVRFFLIDAFLTDTRERLAAEAEKFHIGEPILLDDAQEISRELNITRTGEALIIDPTTWRIVFRGPVDNRFSYSAEKTQSNKSYLESALDQFLKHQPVTDNRIPGVGCAITYEWPKQVTYDQISEILQNRCYQCHQPNGNAPTNLWTFESVKSWSHMLREVVRTEQMPPWETNDAVGPHFVGIKKLTASEKKMLYTWIESGFPEGRGTQPISEKPALETTSAPFRHDLTLATKEQIQIPAGTKTPWHYELLMGNVPEDIWISGTDFHFSNRFIVQHVALLVMKGPMDISRGIFQPEWNEKGQIYNIIRVSAQRNRSARLRDGLAFKIPKGSYVYLEAHFTQTGKPESEDIVVHLEKYRRRQPPTELKLVEIEAPLHIPPNQESYKTQAFYKIKKDSYIDRVGAHMHWRGKAASLIEHRPDGSSETLLNLRYVFKNRRVYSYEKPVFLPAGTALEARFEFDNSSSNPARIEHDADVTFGPDALLNEMATMHVYLFPAPDAKPANSRPLAGF